MPIACFEGPSAVGKTTMAQRLVHTLGAVVIPEVALLFACPADPPPTWYFERQVERWQQAMTAGQSGDLVILDGDPFQPFWYNWAYRYVGWQPLDTLVAFYAPQLQKGTINFPAEDRAIALVRPEHRGGGHLLYRPLQRLTPQGC